MAFFSFLDDSWDIKTLFDRDLTRYGPIRELWRAIMRGPSSFSEAERELLAAFVSSVNQCQFCADGHAVRAAQRGFNVLVLNALMTNIDSAPVSDRLKPVFRFVKKLTEQPARMVQADLNAVRAAGWDETALQDLITLCAYFNMVNRIADGHGLKALNSERRTASETRAR